MSFLGIMEKISKKFWTKSRGIVIGANGKLGASVVSAFKETWEMTSIDAKPNFEAYANIEIDLARNTEVHSQVIEAKLSGKYDMIICAAGGWCSGDIEDPNIFAQTEFNLKTNLYPNLLASYLASKYLTELGMVIHTGSSLAFKENTPSMLAFGLAKNTVHALSLITSTRSHVSSEAGVICILPGILKTAVNISAMPSEIHHNWVAPDEISALVLGWTREKNRPPNGSFVGFKKEKGRVTQEYL